jgi:hypothetical protein
MELTLNHAQRINLHALLGAQRGPTLDDTRAFWRLQDLIGLSEAEKKQIDFRIVQVAEGAFAPQWNAQKSLEIAPRGFEFAAEELARVERAVKEWQPGFFAAMDRAWLEPLLNQFEELRPAAAGSAGLRKAG